MTERLSEDIRRLIDGELDPTEVGRVLRAAAADDAARDLLRMEFRMRRTFDEHREAAWAVPDGFADRVMHHVRHRGAEARSRESRGEALSASRIPEGPGAWMKRMLDTLITARPVMLRPAFALAIILLLAAGVVLTLDGGGASFGERGRDSSSQPETASSDDEVLVPFVYIEADASSVAVAGDFNDWEPTRLQRKNVDGRIVWTGLVPVSRGEHRYMFVIDGTRWESDPLAPVHRDDGFGNTNAILAL